MAGKFVLQKSSANGQFFFNLLAENGERILTSEMYTTKASAQSGISSVKQNAPLDSRYVRNNPRVGEYYFVLKAANAEPLGRSEMYTTSASMEVGIASVKRNAPNAATEDRS